MRKLLQRVFGRGPDDNASPSGPLAPEAYDQLVGENALLELVFERGLGDLIVARLKALEGWPFDLGDALFEDEKLILNLWGFSRAVMNIRAVSIEEGQAFLDRIHHDFVYPKLLKASTQTLEDCFQLRTFSARTVERYPEYEAAYDEMMKCRRELHDHPDTGPRVPDLPFVRAVTRNLFGRETDDVKVTFITGIVVMDHFLSFAETLGSEKGWTSFQKVGQNLSRRCSICHNKIEEKEKYVTISKETNRIAHPKCVKKGPSPADVKTD